MHGISFFLLKVNNNLPETNSIIYCEQNGVINKRSDMKSQLPGSFYFITLTYHQFTS
jgi:hypothetical protein